MVGAQLLSSVAAGLLLGVLLLCQTTTVESASRRDSVPRPRVTPMELYRRGPSLGGGITCTPNQTFTCSDGKCIPIGWKCDGDLDCAQGEDENACSGECGEHEFKCGSRGLETTRGMTGCIPEKWLCDGEYDCDDQSDEKNCGTITCKEDQFKCSEFDGQFQLCIPLTWKCDGQNDCASGDDEKSCEEKQCAATDFKCNNGVCIFHSWRCDGEDDCGDGSDERNCKEGEGTGTCESKGMFKCKNGVGCIPKEWECDGESDCRDHSDEQDCKQAVPANCKLPTEFACKTGRHCINKLWMCDGEVDCPDGSDEADCQVRECGPGEKKCPGPSGQCFPKNFWCNGVENCPDGSDEEDCKDSNRTITCNEATEYRCPSDVLHCVPREKLCTDAKAYGCGDDTTCAQNITECTKGAEYCKCHDSYANDVKVCLCDRGFRSINGVCEDINECQTPGVCDQLCTNLPGSFRCSCHPGYKLSKGREGTVASKCRALGGDPLVLLSNRASIRQFDMVTNEHQPLIRSPGSAVAMDFHLTNGTLIWSDIALQKILMCKIGNDSDHSHLVVKEKCDAGDQSVVYDGDVHTPDGLAIDWVHNLLFWTDGGLDQINVMNLDTRKKRVLFGDALEEPRAIAVDPEMGLIFWTDWGKEARIERAGMDGSYRRVIVKGDLVKWPNGLALDLLQKRVYWADAKVKSIYSADYWGGDIKVVLHSHSYLRHPFSLSVFEDRVYFTDWEHDGVITVNKFTGGDVQKLMGRVSTPMTVRIYHKQAQPDHVNKCEQSGCSEKHICLPTAALQAESREAERLRKYQGHPFSCICAGEVAGIAQTAECIAEMVSGGSGFSPSTMLFMLLLAIFVVAGYVFYRNRTRGGTFTALNFDNPVYRRTVEQEMDDPFRDPFRDESSRPGPTQVEQPTTQTPSRLVVHEDVGDDRNTMVESMDQHLTT